MSVTFGDWKSKKKQKRRRYSKLENMQKQDLYRDLTIGNRGLLWKRAT